MDAAQAACESLYNECKALIHINDDILAANVEAISPASVLFDVRRVALPLRFSNARQEVNFHSVASMLLGRESLGLRWTGVEKLLKASSDHDLTDTLLFGLIGMHLGGVELHAERLSSLSEFDVSQFLNVSLTKSVPISEEQPGMAEGIYVERPSAYAPFVKDVKEALAHTGRATDAQGYADLGELVTSAAREAHDLTAADGGSVEDKLVELLGRRMPALRERELDVASSKRVALRSLQLDEPMEGTAEEAESSILLTCSVAQLIWEVRNRLRAGRENSEGESTAPLYFSMEGISDEAMLRFPSAPTISCISLLLSSGVLEVDVSAMERLREAAEKVDKSARSVKVGDPQEEENGAVSVAFANEGQQDADERQSQAISDLEVLQSCDAVVYAAATVACKKIAEALNRKAEEQSLNSRVSALDVSKWLDTLAKKAEVGQSEEPVQGTEYTWNPDTFKAFPGKKPLFLTKPL